MDELKKKEVWFITGSQHLYGPGVLKQVADDFLLKKHYERKHGKKAYYGQKKKE